jgi:rod shape-determining protein MreD
MNWLQLSVCVVLTLLAVAAEAMISLPQAILGAQLQLLPPIIVYCAVRSEILTLAVVAFLGGLWTDCLSANPLGVTILPLLGVGMLIRAWREMLLQELSYAQFILGLIASAAIPALTVLLLVTTGHQPALGAVSLWQWVVVTATGGVLTPPLFRFLDWVEGLFAYQPAPESVFRKDREIKRGRN